MFPEALREEARILLTRANPERALTALLLRSSDKVPLVELARAAIALRAAAPTDRAIWSATDDIVFTQVPAWHWRMLQDRPRNDAYQTAIEVCVEPGMLVLEIGAGTGLLAMMAVRAGASHVYTVEANPLMAEIAQACIARNGMEERVTVISGHSSDLVPGRDLPRRADLLIHEILSATVVTEGVLPSVAHAREALLVPNAPLLPDHITVEAALSGDMLAGENPWWEAGGFDLSPLALIDANAHGVRGLGKRRLSEATPIAVFDLTAEALLGERRARHRLVLDRDGMVTGVEQWMQARFPDGTTLSSDAPSSHWGTTYHPFGASAQCRAGDAVAIEVLTGPARLSIGLDEAVEAQSDTEWELGL